MFNDIRSIEERIGDALEPFLATENKEEALKCYKKVFEKLFVNEAGLPKEKFDEIKNEPWFKEQEERFFNRIWKFKKEVQGIR